ncbi:MAG: helix-turn-helix transcriptional regulator [Nitrospirae bacterium]|nr:helix-turn-helix transcriptional regulator [Nitrospirota bacterium]MBF0542707.1 helix-turn-helix transcriptional regulator [Nitrospirota bacterium]
MDNRKLLGAKIAEYRKQKGLTQNELSEIIKLDPKSLSRIEVGGSYPSLSVLDKISAALNIELCKFFEFDDQTKDMEQLINDMSKIIKGASHTELKTAITLLKTIIK